MIHPLKSSWMTTPVVGVNSVCTFDILSGECLPKNLLPLSEKSTLITSNGHVQHGSVPQLLCLLSVLSVSKCSQCVRKHRKYQRGKRSWEKKSEKIEPQNLQNTAVNTKRKEKGKRCSTCLSRYLQCGMLSTWHLRGKLKSMHSLWINRKKMRGGNDKFIG